MRCQRAMDIIAYCNACVHASFQMADFCLRIYIGASLRPDSRDQLDLTSCRSHTYGDRDKQLCRDCQTIGYCMVQTNRQPLCDRWCKLMSLDTIVDDRNSGKAAGLGHAIPVTPSASGFPRRATPRICQKPPVTDRGRRPRLSCRRR